jgi:nuclear pore complex protein Nup85
MKPWLSKNILPQQSAAQPENLLGCSADHFRSLYTSFSLFMVLYMPDPTCENDPVGDDLMEWLNVHFIEPSTEEGDHLSGLDRPWEDDAFWPYLTRCVWTCQSISLSADPHLGPRYEGL